nr:cellulose biosynthesis cyclic di-GMP-binding regulatory protein BcsB [Burkholderia savannae]
MRAALASAAVASTMAAALQIAEAAPAPAPASAADFSASRRPDAGVADGRASQAQSQARSQARSEAHLPFSSLGAYDVLKFRGVDATRIVNAGVRLDRVVNAARLRLVYAYSPALVFAVSHLKVTVNGEAVATVPFAPERAGRTVTQDVPIDSRLLSDFNQIGLHLVAHYTLDHCEDPNHSSLWADVSPSSELILDEEAMRLPNDLALLPVPFFDRRDNDRLTLPFVLPAAPDDATLRSAGVLASWFGALASYRHARFPLASAPPAGAHAVVVGIASALPAGLSLPAIDGPMLIVADNPSAADKKLLVVTGRTAAEVDEAVRALVLGKAALSGPWARIARVDAGPPRKPYDAPRWLPVTRPVAFRELAEQPDALEVRGSAPDPIRLNLRLPADLHSWSGAGVPLLLRYRYTAPTVPNNSTLSVEINEQLVKSYRLPLASADDARGRLQLPLLSDPDARRTSAVDIPAFRVGSANQLQLRFNLDSQQTGWCSGVASQPQRAAIDPDSTIDFSHFVHYAELPNLAYFANSGFPFTRYADLLQTAVVIADAPSPQEIEAFLAMLGHMGEWTGFPALRVALARERDAAGLVDKDLLVVDGGSSFPLLDRWRAALPVVFGARPADGMVPAAFAVTERWRVGDRRREGSALLEQRGALGALLGFELPGSRGRSVVALTATDAQRLGDLLDVFDKPGLVAQVQGDLALVRADAVDSMRVNDTYIVGYVSWYERLWGHAAKHPLLLGISGVLAGLLLTLAAFGVLQRIAERRRRS